MDFTNNSINKCSEKGFRNRKTQGDTGIQKGEYFHYLKPSVMLQVWSLAAFGAPLTSGARLSQTEPVF